MTNFKESLIEKLKLEKSGKMTRTWELFDKGIDRAIEIIRQHESQQPSEDVVERVAKAIFHADLAYSKDDDYDWQAHIPEAKAAIAAMNMGDVAGNGTGVNNHDHSPDSLRSEKQTNCDNIPDTLNHLMEELKEAYEWQCPEDQGNAFAIAWEKYLRGGSTVGTQPENATPPVQTTAPEANCGEIRVSDEAQMAQIIDRFWQLHSIEPATGFTPEELAKEIANGIRSR